MHQCNQTTYCGCNKRPRHGQTKDIRIKEFNMQDIIYNLSIEQCFSVPPFLSSSLLWSTSHRFPISCTYAFCATGSTAEGSFVYYTHPRRVSVRECVHFQAG